jgi:hypothetical protein
MLRVTVKVSLGLGLGLRRVRVRVTKIAYCVPSSDWITQAGRLGQGQTSKTSKTLLLQVRRDKTRRAGVSTIADI